MSARETTERLGGRRRQLTDEQRAACEQLRRFAAPHRFRVQLDVDGFPEIPGRYGRIEWFDGKDLAVYTDRPRLFARLWALPGGRRHQTGDTEMRAVFPPGVVERVAQVIRAKRWGGAGRGRPENFLGKVGQKATSRVEDTTVGAGPGSHSIPDELRTP